MRNKILDILSDSESYISGEEISRRLGISRAAVWKHIKKLKDEGYSIQSVTNKGYCLRGMADVISEEEIGARLKTEFTARNIKYTRDIDSTNEEAKRSFAEPDGTLFTAERQTAGKGRLGRKWQSPSGAGVCMSLLLKPDIAPADISQITLIAGIAVCRAIGGTARIKWPNDVILGTRKVCGILTEMSAETDRVNYVICGIGINVNTESFPDELKDKATSLYIETGKSFNRSRIIADVMNEFEPLYKHFLSGGISPVLDEYRRLCATIGRDVRVIYRKETLYGTAADISPDGSLIIESDGKRINISSGEVSVRGIYGYI